MHNNNSLSVDDVIQFLSRFPTVHLFLSLAVFFNLIVCHLLAERPGDAPAVTQSLMARIRKAIFVGDNKKNKLAREPYHMRLAKLEQDYWTGKVLNVLAAVLILCLAALYVYFR
jgi:hypothetical protein